MPLTVDSNINNGITVKSSHIAHLDLLARVTDTLWANTEANQQVQLAYQGEPENVFRP